MAARYREDFSWPGRDVVVSITSNENGGRRFVFHTQPTFLRSGKVKVLQYLPPDDCTAEEKKAWRKVRDSALVKQSIVKHKDGSEEKVLTLSPYAKLVIVKNENADDPENYGKAHTHILRLHDKIPGIDYIDRLEEKPVFSLMSESV